MSYYYFGGNVIGSIRLDLLEGKLDKKMNEYAEIYDTGKMIYPHWEAFAPHLDNDVQLEPDTHITEGAKEWLQKLISLYREIQKIQTKIEGAIN